MQIRQLFSWHVTFLWANEISHDNSNLPNRRFLHEQFLISKYSPILQALLHSQSHMPWFHLINNCIRLHSIHIYNHTIYAEQKIVFHLPSTLNQILLYSYFLLYLEHIFEHIDHHQYWIFYHNSITLAVKWIKKVQ